MKIQTVKIIVVLIFLIGGGLIMSVAYASWKIRKYEKACAEVSKLGIFIQQFESEKGRYPNSMSELESNVDEIEQGVVVDIIQNKWNNQYEYRDLKDCVQINVKGYRFTCKSVANGFEVGGDFTTNVMTTVVKDEHR